MAVTHGSKAELKLNDGGALRDFSPYLTSTGMNRLRELAETTPIGGSTYKTYISGLRDGTIPLEGNFDVTVDGWLETIYGLSTSAAFEYYPSGNDTGLPKYTGTYVLTSYEVETGAGDKGSISAEVQITGAVTRAIV